VWQIVILRLLRQVCDRQAACWAPSSVPALWPRIRSRPQAARYGRDESGGGAWIVGGKFVVDLDARQGVTECVGVTTESF
jgi:hypothetical protein